jgi:hypothetical protein
MFTVASCPKNCRVAFWGSDPEALRNFHSTARRDTRSRPTTFRQAKNQENALLIFGEPRVTTESRRHICSTAARKQTELSYVNAGATVRIVADARAAALVQAAEINKVVADEPLKSTL